MKDEQLDNLEEELQELLARAEKFLGYQADDINHIVEDLLSLNKDEADILAADIMSIEEDMIIVEGYYEEDENEDPFNTLYDQDTDSDL
jgi:hypothetical protein